MKDPRKLGLTWWKCLVGVVVGVGIGVGIGIGIGIGVGVGVGVVVVVCLLFVVCCLLLFVVCCLLLFVRFVRAHNADMFSSGAIHGERHHCSLKGHSSHDQHPWVKIVQATLS